MPGFVVHDLVSWKEQESLVSPVRQDVLSRTEAHLRDEAFAQLRDQLSDGKVYTVQLFFEKEEDLSFRATKFTATAYIEPGEFRCSAK